MTVFKIGDTGAACPCGKHVACVPGCALMDYPGYIVDWQPLATPQLRAQQGLMPRTLEQEWQWQQREAEKSDVHCGLEDDGFRTVHPRVDWLDERITVPNSPSLPDVTRAKPKYTMDELLAQSGARVTQVPLEEVRGTDWLAADTAAFEQMAADIHRDGGDYLAGDAWPTTQTPEPKPMNDVRTNQATHTYNKLDEILAQRGGRYGAFAHNASIAQQLKLTFRRHPFAQWDGLAEDQQEALDQIAAKISRMLVGDPTYVDNWDDIAGYAKLVAERLRSAS